MGKKEVIAQLKGFKRKLSRDIPIGSRATGKPRKESDVDLIIVSHEFGTKAFRERPLGFYRHWKLDSPFDFLCYTPKEFEKLKKQLTIVREADKTGIII